jgi:hypothetical protein
MDGQRLGDESERGFLIELVVTDQKLLNNSDLKRWDFLSTRNLLQILLVSEDAFDGIWYDVDSRD